MLMKINNFTNQFFRRLIPMMLFLFLSAVGVFAQKVISGKVTASDNGETLPGVNVWIKGTNRGTTTDIDGNFKMEIHLMTGH